LKFYEKTRRATRRRRLLTGVNPLGTLLDRVAIEWNLFAQKAQSVISALSTDHPVEKAS
jgi:hypothetical protein